MMTENESTLASRDYSVKTSFTSLTHIEPDSSFCEVKRQIYQSALALSMVNILINF